MNEEGTIDGELLPCLAATLCCQSQGYISIQTTVEETSLHFYVSLFSSFGININSHSGTIVFYHLSKSFILLSNVARHKILIDRQHTTKSILFRLAILTILDTS
jgi:hypothetical protein